MTAIYELYDALLTIKDYCASNWKLVEPTRNLCE